MKRTLSLLLAAILLLSLTLTLCGCRDYNVGTGACEYATSRDTTDRDIKYVRITVRDYGSIIALLDATTAPKTVANFLSLVNDGFYDGLTFHRVMENFMIQGGCPNGDGTGTTDPIEGEFGFNGHSNDIAHIRGVISMARRPSFDSASCQFFICNADARSSLDYQYAAFGYVIAGMSVVDAITDTCAPLTSSLYGNVLAKKDQPVIEQIVQISEKKALRYCD